MQTKPDPKDYGLPEDASSAFREYNAAREKKDYIIEIGIAIVLLAILTALYMCFLNGKKYSNGFSFADTNIIGAAFMMILPSLLVSSLIFKIIHRSNKNSLRSRYDRYMKDLMEYNHEQEQKTISYWESLDGHQFEHAVASLYRKHGYHAVVSKAGGDGGIDIVLTKDNKKIAVQCKAHNKPVGPGVARDLFGTMISQGYKEGMLVSTHGFTKGVYEFVQNKPISLITLTDLIRMT